MGTNHSFHSLAKAARQRDWWIIIWIFLPFPSLGMGTNIAFSQESGYILSCQILLNKSKIVIKEYSPRCWSISLWIYFGPGNVNLDFLKAYFCWVILSIGRQEVNWFLFFKTFNGDKIRWITSIIRYFGPSLSSDICNYFGIWNVLRFRIETQNSSHLSFIPS